MSGSKCLPIEGNIFVAKKQLLEPQLFRKVQPLRHSYISFRLLEGADIYQIAKNCRTSVEMIEKHYAVHLKNNLDAAAINVRRVRSN